MKILCNYEAKKMAILSSSKSRDIEGFNFFSHVLTMQVQEEDAEGMTSQNLLEICLKSESVFTGQCSRLMHGSREAISCIQRVLHSTSGKYGRNMQTFCVQFQCLNFQQSCFSLLILQVICTMTEKYFLKVPLDPDVKQG